ncbi:Crp/Fnr family transcriptional regulator [uncultured Algibacter sp.]|uniref:Crp/Fnr family transcriptional regulator n=1 Tax=uncultured Algibacter sp. TaxID=298659 RepID=UPI002607B689|nr:Crp/Fnr family transcriptional regulator [uncultured Algibacter sp.]
MKEYQIFKNIQKHISLSNTEREFFISILIEKDIAKKEIVLEQGSVSSKLYFVEFGSLRAFNVNEEGRESTIMLAVQDWWITDMYSFVNKKPALLSIETLEVSRLIEFDFIMLEKLYKRLPKFERFFRILFQNAYIREQLRVLDNISFTTEQRYTRFIDKYPQIVKKVTQKQIASYLGVTPEFLSSVKKKLS